MTEKRFDDREVALILRRAAELEKSASSSVALTRGLTLKELQEVASEAGIDPALVSRAAAELQGRAEEEPWRVAGPLPVRREVRTLPAELPRSAMGELMRVVDQEVAAQGTVVEALGAVRWSSNGRILDTQVSLEPFEGETMVRVEERYSDALRGILHALPGIYGIMFGMVIGLEGMGVGLAVTLVIAVVLGMAGWGLGDLIWRGISAGSGKRVGALAERLSDEGARLLPQGESTDGLDP